MNAAVERYWRQYLATLSADRRPAAYLEAFSFGIEPGDALPIAELVLAGVKTTTGSLLWAREADGQPIPVVGDLSIVLDAERQPLCIIETFEVAVRPLDTVDADLARDGGEGDRSLAYWREIYWEYVQGECARIGRAPSWQAPIVCERFRVVYRAPLEPA